MALRIREHIQAEKRKRITDESEGSDALQQVIVANISRVSVSGPLYMC